MVKTNTLDFNGVTEILITQMNSVFFTDKFYSRITGVSLDELKTRRNTSDSVPIFQEIWFTNGKGESVTHRMITDIALSHQLAVDSPEEYRKLNSCFDFLGVSLDSLYDWINKRDTVYIALMQYWTSTLKNHENALLKLGR